MLLLVNIHRIRLELSFFGRECMRSSCCVEVWWFMFDLCLSSLRKEQQGVRRVYLSIYLSK